GNLSALSNELRVSRDRRAPRASIVSPAFLTRLDGLTEIIAETPDQDVQTVRFEVRAGTAGFVPVGTASKAPWSVDLDVSTLASPVIELRAIATDHGGRSDVDPPAVTVFFDPALALL